MTPPRREHPTHPVIENMTDQPSTRSSSKRWPSAGFVAAISTILGIVLAASALLGGLGKAFFVTRSEYTQQLIVDTGDKTDLQKSLQRLEGVIVGQGGALEKQDQSLQKLIDKVQLIREDIARKGR